MTAQTSKSSGSEGSRGSRGEANSGAQDGTATNQDAEPAGGRAAHDLRDDDARGGGGIASGSSRSRDADRDDETPTNRQR
jgi:hypothetical protein